VIGTSTRYQYSVTSTRQVPVLAPLPIWRSAGPLSHPRSGVRAAVCAEPEQNVVHVVLDRLFLDREFQGDLRVRKPLGNETDHFGLAGS
jgi:hypothetical protein